MKIGQAGWGLGLALLLGAADAMASVIHVKASAAGANSGLSWADAYTDLQAALAAATSGDEIWVAEGTYKPTTGTDVTKSFLMKGGAGLYGGFSGNESLRGERNWNAYPTILSGDIGVPGNFSDNSKTVVVGAANAPLDGFTVAGGRNLSSDIYDRTAAGGMRSTGSDIANCTFTGNTGGAGGAVYIQSGTSQVTNCIFSANSATSPNLIAGGGGGIYASNGSTSIIGCTFAGNSTSGFGGAVECGSGSVSIANCAFSGNSADNGGGIASFSASVAIANCVFSANTAKTDGGAVYCYQSINVSLTCCTLGGNSSTNGGAIRGTGSIDARNCIFWKNKAPVCPEISHLGEISHVSTMNACDVRGSGGSGLEWNRNLGTDGGANIMVDPQFADSAHPEGADGIWFTADDGWRLAPNSPCIDAGSNFDIPLADVLGNPRTTDGNANGQSICDIGAYEFQLSGSPVPPAQPPAPQIRFVKTGASGSHDGSSWLNAYGDLQSALAAANWGDEIRVAEGTYKPTNGTNRLVSFLLEPGVALYGGFAGTEATREARDWGAHPTILSGNIGASGSALDNTMQVVMGAHGAALDGFTVSGGQNTNFSGILASGAGMANTLVSPYIANCSFTGNYCIYNGGGLYNNYASPRIADCIFSGNTCPYGDGGGMCSDDSSPAVIDCSFNGNSAFREGGGMKILRGSPEVTGCTFIGNSCSFENGGGMAIIGGSGRVADCTLRLNSTKEMGGGIFLGVEYTSGNARRTVANCAFIGNSAAAGGGIAFGSYSVDGIVNCIAVGNSASQGGGLYNFGASPVLTNCTFFGNTAKSSGAGGYSAYGTPTAHNCIFQGDLSPASPELNLINGSNFGFFSCDIQGSGGSGAQWKHGPVNDKGGNIDADARFVRPGLPAGPDGIYRTADDGLALHAGSPCIDAAAGEYALATDILGNIRPFDGNADGQDGCDIGAYEAINPLNSAAGWQLYR